MNLSRDSAGCEDQIRELRITEVHGFILGAATHWYSAAVVPNEPKIYFFDSYNVTWS